jgi:3D (Asp-Asp-Asp) domain-containing protein
VNFPETYKKTTTLKKRFNLIAVLILVFNLSSPHLAVATQLRETEDVGPTLTADPGSRLVRQAIKPKIINAVITAYTSTPDQTDGDPFTTASGSRVEFGTIAANGVPFGTVVKIPELFGDQRFIVADRMNSRYGFGHFDVWLPGDRDKAVHFGVKRVKVEIYLEQGA